MYTKCKVLNLCLFPKRKKKLTPSSDILAVRKPNNEMLQEIKAGRHGDGPFHIYGRHIERVSGHNSAGARNKKHRNIIDVL